VRSGSGNGGNINIDPTFVILDNSQIIANAFGGNGGNINIVADFFMTTTESLVQASSQLGIDGEVTIDAVQTDIIGDLTQLPASYLNATALLREPCAVRTLQRSSFIVVGRGALPIAPGSMLRGGISDLPGTNTRSSVNTQLVGGGNSLSCGS
jgi:large exoprotein involved in heme utilization and adhesion